MVWCGMGRPSWRDQLIGIANRYRLQHDRIHEREDGNVSPNTESDCQDGKRRETGILPQLAQRVTKILCQSPHSQVSSPARTIVPLC